MRVRWRLSYFFVFLRFVSSESWMTVNNNWDCQKYIKIYKILPTREYSNYLRLYQLLRHVVYTVFDFG
jgi:hypothetical protein